MSAVERVDRFQQKHPWSGFPIAVVYKFFDDQGSYLAALITYYAFLSLFPLLLLLSTIAGFVLHGNPELQARLLDTAFAQFPAIGSSLREELGKPGGPHGSPTAVVVSIVFLLYGGMGVAQAAQNAMNVMWAVPRNNRPNPVLARVRSLILLATVGLALIGITILSSIGSTGSVFGVNGGLWLKAVVLVLSVALTTGIFVLGFQIATARRLTVDEMLPGAIGAAVVWRLLQSFGTTYVRHVVAQSNATSAVIAVVLGLIAFLYLEAMVVVLCVEVNVVRSARLYPRSLLTPFTDDVVLTRADERAYTGYAKAQRNKGFEDVDVSFGSNELDPDGPPAPPGGHGHQRPTHPSQ